MKTVLYLLLGVPAVFAQQAISVQSGLIHHTEGVVEKDGLRIRMERNKFPQAKVGEIVATREGRAEMLLTPGVFLRLAPNSSVRMLSTSLTDTRVEVVSGAALVEVAEITKPNKVAIQIAQSETPLERFGLYQFDAGAQRIRVYEGKLAVHMSGQNVEIGKGRQALLSPQLTAAKFSLKEREMNGLYTWSVERADLIQRANIGAATAYRSSGYRALNSMWTFYPNFGILTFLPYSGFARSAFGLGYYSPRTIWQYYAPRVDAPPSYGGGAHSQPTWSGMGGSPNYSGSSTGSAPAASVGMGRSSAPAASAPAVSAPSGGRSR